MEDTEVKEKADNQIMLSQDATVVKSDAILKYANIEMPAQFHELQKDTDLNEPPSNWLHGSSKWETSLQNVSLGKEHSFSSFKMAHCFPDLAGEIDVISDSENIKKLLKIPYSKGHVSMMVHRVGNTLLLDDFDVHKYLLRKELDEWRWLRKFYYDTILRSMQNQQKDKCIVKKNKSRDHLQNRNLFSKFLYHSMGIAEENEDEVEEELQGSTVESRSLEASFQCMPDPLQQPRPDEVAHDRTTEWTFEDIRMLIGTDLPIFGGTTHPCLSLRLRDMHKPISILSGVDYWLDNLMCNVPEIAMCYHLNGIVQSYELMKTEEIPNIESCKFSPGVVKDIASNILSFLKSNATKEGHTYWLFKGHDDDIVKLYDLTTLCSDVTEDKTNNPFTAPVGILLYRVARNMRQNCGRKKAGTIRTLLKNCLLLLDKELHSQVITSAHFLLSDLYIADNITEMTTNDKDSDETDTDDSQSISSEEDSEENPASSLEVRALSWPDSVKKPSADQETVRHPPIRGNLEERCREALKHIAEGLACLDDNVDNTLLRQEASKHEEEEQEVCNPSEAIPLPYQPLHSTGATDIASNDNGSASQGSEVIIFNKTSLPVGTWHNLSKTLLLRKAAVAYFGLAESKMAVQKYGQALKYIVLALRVFGAVAELCPSKADENQNLLGAILGLSGDVHLMLVKIAQHLEAHREDFKYQIEEDLNVLGSAKKEFPAVEKEYAWISNFTPDVQHNIDKSIESYELAISKMEHLPDSRESLRDLKKRLGNVRNEQGVFYMSQATALIHECSPGKVSEQTRDMLTKSQTCLESGLKVFEGLKDAVNQALLHANTGRLMRLQAQCHIEYKEDGTRKEFGALEKVYFKKAHTHYLEAMRLLQKRENCLEIWDSIHWELSTTYFNMATLLQDYAPLTKYAHEQVEKEVTDFMNKALKYCDVETNSPRQPACQYRAATIHHRLASLYHNSYRNQIGDQKRKQLKTMAELHYDKASKFFDSLESSCELLRVQLERVALCEYQLTIQTSPNSKVKTLQTALNYVFQCKSPLVVLENLIKESTENGTDELESYRDEIEKLLPILESRLKFLLLTLLKNSSLVKKGKMQEFCSTEVYRAMYGIVLKKLQFEENLQAVVKCSCLRESISEIYEIYQEKTHSHTSESRID